MMNFSKNAIRLMLVALPFAVTACGSKKKLVDDGGKNVTTTVVNTPETNSPSVNGIDNVAYLGKVTANAQNVKNLVASIDFNLKSGSKNISVDGKLSMRKDEVIRIQLSPMGLMEVGRMEFSKDSVLIIDRIHKQYLKSGYDQVSFLRNNGIDFQSLQALFWNQLFVPGEKGLTPAAIRQYEIDGDKIKLNKGKMTYIWETDPKVEHVNSATATYNSSKNGTSQLSWNYDNFKTYSGKAFPATHQIKIIADAAGKNKTIEVVLSLKNMKNDTGWDTTTKVSSKYKPVELKDVINQILKLQ